MKTFLKNGTLINANGEIFTGYDLLINGKVIWAVGQGLDCPQDARVIDCTGKFITPGFASMHVHSPMNIFKGIAEDVNIDDWFNKEIWPYESKMQDEDIYWGAKLAAAEMINNGITVFADHYFKSHLIAKACKELGIRADIAYTIFGFDGDCTRELELAEKFYNEFKDDEMISPRMGPHSPYICTPRVLKIINEKARELGCGIHIHVSETELQVQQNKDAHNGKTPFDVIAETGGFDLPCIVGHGLWIEESDLKYINENMIFAHAPKTYAKLGAGMGNLFKFKDQIPLATATDGSASSNSLDVLEQAKIHALLGKLFDKAEDFRLENVWKLLFNGHKYLNFNSGDLKEGMAADINIFDLSTVSTAPVYNPLAAIIYSATAAVNITDVIINGKFVKKDGRLTFDTKEIIDNASRCAKEIYARGKGVTKLYF